MQLCVCDTKLAGYKKGRGFMDVGGLTSAYTDFIATQADGADNKVQDKLNSDYANATSDELMDACKQFEAYFLEQMFKSMMKTVPESEYSSASTSTMMDYYKDNMLQELASESTEQNSLGLAQMLYEQMKRNYDI